MNRKITPLASIALICAMILPVYAGSWTKNPPYSMGSGSKSGGLTGLGMWCSYYYVSPSSGKIRVLAASEGLIAGEGWAKAEGWLMQWWPSAPPGWRPPGQGGGCPFVSVWDGTEYLLDNNVLPISELSRGEDVEDYYKLEVNPVQKNGRESFLISEFEQELSFIDRVGLVVIDHNSDVKIAVTQQGEILTYKNLLMPKSAIDQYGRNLLDEIQFKDGDVLNSTTFFEGYPGDSLVMNFGKVSSENAKLILRTDMKKSDECIVVQVLSTTGSWQTVDTLVPRSYWADQAVNLKPYLIEGKELMVRLYWKWHHRLDYVGLSTTEQSPFEVRSANLVQAEHSAVGNVKESLGEADGDIVELSPDQHIRIDFTVPDNNKAERTYMLRMKGHYVHQSAESNVEAGEDPVVSLDTKIRLDGSALLTVVGVPPQGAGAQMDVQVRIKIRDYNTGTYVTNSLLESWSHTVLVEGGASETWNYDKDYHITFQADLTHLYQIWIGVTASAHAAAGGAADAYVNIDLYSNGGGATVKYIYLSWA